MNITLDNSALSLLSCRRRFQLTVIHGLISQPSIYAQMGDAFHKVLECLDAGKSVDVALKEALDRNPQVEKLPLVSLVTAFKATQKLPSPIEIAGKLAIEFKFRWLYGSYLTDAGKKINVYLAGTIDRIFLDKKILVFLDYKTAADYSIDKQKAKMDDYELAFQLPWYVYNMLQSGLLPEKYVDMIKNNQYRTEVLFAFYSPSPPIFRTLKHEPFNVDFLYREIPTIINNKISDAIKITQLSNNPAPHDGMCVYKACSYCPYRVACLHMGSDKEEELLSRFQRKEYNPLTFR